MFILATITKWESHRDGKMRVGKIDLPTGRSFLINPNRLVDIRTKGNGSKFLFFDNHWDSRESASYIESTSTVEELRIFKDTNTSSLFITLPLHRNAKINKPTTNVTITVEDIAYFDAYRPNPPNATWVIYIKNGFKRVEELCALSLQEIYDLLSVIPFTSNDQYVTLSDDEGQWRKGVRDGKFVLDKTLTGVGFLGTEGIDWENVKNIS